MKHIIVALDDEDDEYNDLVVLFAEKWEKNQIQTRKSTLTGKGTGSAGRKTAAGDALDNPFNFQQLNKLKGLEMPEVKQLLRLAISGASPWAEVCEVRLFAFLHFVFLAACRNFSASHLFFLCDCSKPRCGSCTKCSGSKSLRQCSASAHPMNFP